MSNTRFPSAIRKICLNFRLMLSFCQTTNCRNIDFAFFIRKLSNVRFHSKLCQKIFTQRSTCIKILDLCTILYNISKTFTYAKKVSKFRYIRFCSSKLVFQLDFVCLYAQKMFALLVKKNSCSFDVVRHCVCI